jgi:hypothetical protein
MLSRGRARLCRAALILVCCGAVLSGQAVGVVPARGGPRLAAVANPIVAENALPGTQGWSAGTNSPISGIDGYTSQLSVTPGQGVQLHITAAAGTRYRIEVYRLGWYQGIGARLLTCVPSCTSDEAAASRPLTPAPDPVTGYVDAGWPVTDDVTTGSNWVSGYYMAKLVVTVGAAGQVRFIPFVVREASPASPILVQVPVNTWEAYNNWGGKSLYTAGSTGGVAATVVSFNRPFITTGVNWPLAYEYPLVRFLESRGYFVSYGTDVDTDQNVDAPSARSLVITAGHDEYWTKQIRDQLDAAQSTGTNLAVMGANTGYWQMRYDPTYRMIYEYRSAKLDPDPNLPTKTVLFRQLTPPRPECALEGEQDLNGLSTTPINPDFSVATGALTNPWFTGTGFTQSSQVTGVVGYEWDTAGQSGCPAVQTLFTWSGTNVYGNPSTATATMFTAPSGARVFDAGTLQFSWALDSYGHTPPVNPSAQLFMQNLLDDLSRPLAPTRVAPTNTAAPSISGTVVEGQSVTAAAGGWNGWPVPSFGYQWLRCDASGANCTTITGAAGASYVLGPADVGATLIVQVMATNTAGSVVADSPATAVVSSASGGGGGTVAGKPPVVSSASGGGGGTVAGKPPVVSGLSQSATRWRLGSRLASLSAKRKRPPVGTTFTFTLSAAGTTTLVFAQTATGRTVAGRCVAARKSNRHKPRCTLTTGVGRVKRPAHAGVNHVRFQGRLSASRGLHVGHYVVRVSASNAFGTGAGARPLRFTIVR